MSLTKEQQLAVESIDKNILVSAGAGSGKTHVLVERFLEILRCNKQLSVGNIIAVTYTHKAADEMRSRLKERMEFLSKSEAAEAKRWQECLAELDGAKIGTIHSLCQSILKSFPEEAIVDPAFSVLDEMEGAELLNESLEEVLYESVAASAEIHDFLTAYPVELVRKCLDALVKSPITFFEAREKLGALTEEDFARVFKDIADQVKERIVGDVSADKKWRQALAEIETPFADEGNKLEQHRRNIQRLAIRVLEDGPFEERFACMQEIKAIKVATSGGNGDEAKEMRAKLSVLRNINKNYLPDFGDNLNEADIQAIACLKAMIYLADKVLASFSERKLAHQKLDFNDQIMLVYKLLNNKESRARKHYNDTIAAILIDEFQDTNAIQADILERLLGPKARLFLIGDDKQSIYKFQGAEVETFNRWRKRISNSSKSVEGLLVELNKSFRSHPEIVSFVNFVFEELLQDNGIDYRARFQALAPNRSDAIDSPRVEVVAFDGSDEEGKCNNLDVRTVEADVVACWIQEKVQSKVPVFEKATGTTRQIAYGDFAVLVQARKDFVFIEQALAAQGIPYITVAGSGLLYAQEIYDLESVLAFLWCPEDGHALVSVLRSPLVGLGDDLIQQLVAAAKSEQSLWNYLKVAAPSDVRPAVVMLESWLKHASAEAVGRLIQTVIADSNYEAILLSLPNGKQRSRNIWKFQQLSFDHNHMPIGEFLQALQSMRELAVRQSAAPLDMGDSVKLMTIHASKGLEFPAVVLPVLDGRATSNASKLIFHRQFGMAFNSSRSKPDEVPALYEAANHMDRDMQIAEKKRLFYVAATRARDYLSLFVEYGGGERNSFAEWITSVVDIGSVDEEAGVVKKMLAPESPILLRRLDDEALTSWKDKLAVESVSAEMDNDDEQLSLNQQMLEPVSAVLTEPTVDWQLLGRITQATDEATIAPTILGQFFHLIMQRWQPAWKQVPESVLNELAHHKEVRAIHSEQRKRLITEAEKLVETFVNSELCTILNSATRTFREIPYVISAREGRPDLLLEDSNGQWRIIDFKVNKAEFLELNRDQLSKYRAQVLGYLKDIEALTGIRAQAFLYFAREGRLEPVILEPSVV